MSHPQSRAHPAISQAYIASALTPPADLYKVEPATLPLNLNNLFSALGVTFHVTTQPCCHFERSEKSLPCEYEISRRKNSILSEAEGPLLEMTG